MAEYRPSFYTGGGVYWNWCWTSVTCLFLPWRRNDSYFLYFSILGPRFIQKSRLPNGPLDKEMLIFLSSTWTSNRPKMVTMVGYIFMDIFQYFIYFSFLRKKKTLIFWGVFVMIQILAKTEIIRLVLVNLSIWFLWCKLFTIGRSTAVVTPGLLRHLTFFFKFSKKNTSKNATKPGNSPRLLQFFDFFCLQSFGYYCT